MKVVYSDRIEKLPPYLFDRIDRIKNEMIKRGADIIDLGVGDPDFPTPPQIVEVLKKESERAENHRYPFYKGMEKFRKACAQWYKERFDVDIDPTSEVISVIGSKEGLSHIPIAFVNPGDVVLVPEPSYPVYAITSTFAGGEIYSMPLLSENGFLPDLSSIPKDVAKRATLMFINYPNNPTSAMATGDFFKEVIDFAERNNIIVIHDAAYTELYFDDERPMSFLECPGAKDVGMEIHSLSKTFNMTGWRIGAAVGNKDIVGGLGKAKSNMDSGVFQPIQLAAAFALENFDELCPPIREVYQGRRDILRDALGEAGLTFQIPKATFYFWVRVPGGETSESFTTLLLEKAHIVVTPGSGLGASGEGYVRLTLCEKDHRLKEAGERICDVLGVG